MGILLVVWSPSTWVAWHCVSIPSQVGILLVAYWQRPLRDYAIEVSIPSQVGILLVGALCGLREIQYYRLNTLSGGHPLGGQWPASRLDQF